MEIITLPLGRCKPPAQVLQSLKGQSRLWDVAVAGWTTLPLWLRSHTLTKSCEQTRFR